MSGLVPPAGLRLRAGETAGALAGLFRPAEEARRLEKELEKIFTGRRVLLRRSGRAAIHRLFRLCRERRKDRDEVVIGAYTCWSVAAAAVRAGFRLRLVDLSPETFDFDPAALSSVRWERVAALVTHHLFGLPNDRRRAARAAEAGGAWLIDDAAQALGASEGGVVAGGAGEAGVLSFGRGKSLPALGGGALLLAKGGPLEGEVPDGPPRIPGGVVSALRAAGHGAVYGTTLYGPAAGLSFLHVGETVYDEKFAVGPIDGYTAALARRLLLRSEEIARGRREAADSYRALLADAKGIAIPGLLPGAVGAYIRFPILVPPERRERILARAKARGVALYYPCGIDRIPGLPSGALAGPGAFPGAEKIAASLLTLPTHALAGRDVREEIAKAVVEEGA